MKKKEREAVFWDELCPDPWMMDLAGCEENTQKKAPLRSPAATSCQMAATMGFVLNMALLIAKEIYGFGHHASLK